MKPEYNVSLITYFDILGFQDIVKSKPASEILELLMHFKNTSKSDEIDMGEYSRSYNYFSDTIVRSISILSDTNKNRRDGILFYELYDLLHITNELLLKGILIRGAVTIGFIFNDNDIFFGPGVITAYNLEKAAIYPRIVVDKIITSTLGIITRKGTIRKNATEFSKKLLYLLSSDTNRLLDEREFILGMLKKGKDNAWFIDYLGALADEYEEESDFFLLISSHKSLIEKGIRAKIKNPHVLDKYLWLRRYHNNYISEIAKKDRRFLKYLIGEVAV